MQSTPAEIPRVERRARPRPAGETVNVALVGQRPLERLGRVALLVIADLASLFLSAAAAYVVWALPERGQAGAMYVQLAPLLALFVCGYAFLGLYPGFGIGPVETLRRTTYVTAFGFLVLAAFSFALKLPHLYSRVTFTIALAMSLAVVPLTRALVWHLVGRANWWREPVVIVGAGRRALRALNDLRQPTQIGYRPVAMLTIDDAQMPGGADIPVLNGLSHAPALAARGIHTALLEVEQMQDRRVVDALHREFRRVVLLREFDDLPVEGVHVRNLGRMVGIEYTNNLTRRSNRVVKRSLDVMLSAAALVLVSPILITAMAAVLLIDGVPVFYTQMRTGFLGRKLRVPKIRTMRRDAEDRLEEDLAADPELREEWNTHYKLKNDPRLISGIGRFLRRFSVDELPQLWTVLKGDMSLVGPRPFPDYHMAKFSEDFIDLRRRVRPGLTGLWQISIRSGGSITEQESFDSYYIRNWSVWLDLYILSRTIAAVVSGKGAY